MFFHWWDPGTLVKQQKGLRGPFWPSPTHVLFVEHEEVVTGVGEMADVPPDQTNCLAGHSHLVAGIPDRSCPDWIPLGHDSHQNEVPEWKESQRATTSGLRASSFTMLLREEKKKNLQKRGALSRDATNTF